MQPILQTVDDLEVQRCKAKIIKDRQERLCGKESTVRKYVFLVLVATDGVILAGNRLQHGFGASKPTRTVQPCLENINTIFYQGYKKVRQNGSA